MMSRGQPFAHLVSKLGSVKKLLVPIVASLEYGSLQALSLPLRSSQLLGRSLRLGSQPFCTFRWHLRSPGVFSGGGFQCGMDLVGYLGVGVFSVPGYFY